MHYRGIAARVSKSDSAPPETELKLLAARIDKAFDEGRYATVATLIGDDFLATWSCVPPQRLRNILATLVDDAELCNPIIKEMHFCINRANTSPEALDRLIGRHDPRTSSRAVAVHLVLAVELRIQGRSAEALERALKAKRQAPPLQLLFDAHRSWPLFTAVQIGITAMLTGDFQLALRSFTEAQLQTHPSRYSFLARDALVRSALLQAAFGSTDEARRLLTRSERIPRSDCWVDDAINASHMMASALVEDSPTEGRLRKILDLELSHVGELWPYYVLVVSRLMHEAGRLDDLDAFLAHIETLQLAKVDGEGFAGSVLPVLRARLAAANRQPLESAAMLAQADQSIVFTRTARAFAHLHRAEPRQAAGVVSSMPEVVGMRQLEIWRFAIVANAHFMLDDERSSLVALEQAALLWPPMQPHETEVFAPDVRVLAASRIDGWPGGEVVSTTEVFDFMSTVRPGLTDREVEIVRQLASGRSRRQVADELFISLNTVKTQLRSIYRKLGVSSAQDAVREADRNGYL